MRILIATLLLALLVPGLAQEVALVPESPQPGSPAVLQLRNGESVAEVVALSPMGLWFSHFDARQQTPMTIDIPADLSVLLVGTRDQGSAGLELKLHVLREDERATFWRAYFSANQPHFGSVSLDSPLPVEAAQKQLAASAELPTADSEQRWQRIVSIRNARERAQAVLAWLEEYPLSQRRGQLLQLLAATFSELEQHMRTVQYGTMYLDITPTDAMTLNGVAWAMAEAEVDMLRGLVHAERALTILSNPVGLEKPAHLRNDQWREELRNASAATLDTKGWLLTKLERWSEAATAFEAAIKRQQKDVFYLHYAMMLLRSGQTEKAADIIESGLALNGFRADQLRELQGQLEK